MALTEITKVTGPGIHTLSNILSHNINSSGIITATEFDGKFSGNIVGTAATFSGNVTIGGTLTYEDVTNIDSVGIITGKGADINGDLDVDGHTNLDNVNVAGVSTHSDHIHLLDNKRLKVGSATNGDLILLHTGTDSIIDNATGNLFYRSATHKLQALNAHNMIVGNTGGSVELYNNNTKKLETRSNGITVTGYTYSDGVTIGNGTAYKYLAGSGNQLQMYHTGGSGNGYINNTQGTLLIGGPVVSFTNQANNAFLIRAVDGGTAELYFNGSKKFETTHMGGVLSGILTATSFSGDGSNLTGITQTTINNNADNRIITGSGTANTLNGESNLTFDGTHLVVSPTSASNTIRTKIRASSANDDARLGIYFGNTEIAALFGKWSGSAFSTGLNIPYEPFVVTGASGAERLRISSSGETLVTGTLKINDGSTSANRIALGNSGDLIIYNGSNENHIYGSTNQDLIFSTNTTERLRIDSSGTTTASGTSDGVLQLTTTDSRGAFIRFGQGGSYHNMVGCADGLTNGDKEDLGIRAADNIIFAAGGSSEKLRITSNGDIGLGTVPETDSYQPSLYFAGGNANIWGSGNANLYTAVNARYTGGGGWKYNNNGLASYTAQQSGTYEFRNAPSGTADNGASFTTRFQIDTSGNTKFNSGFGSVTTVYGCRAWVKLNQTGTQTINASGGVSSIADLGTGHTQVNFTTTMPDINYAMVGAAQQSSNPSFNYGYSLCMQGRNTGSANFIYRPDATSDTKQDQSQVDVAFFR